VQVPAVRRSWSLGLLLVPVGQHMQKPCARWFLIGAQALLMSGPNP